MLVEIVASVALIMAALVFFNLLFGKGLTADSQDGWYALLGAIGLNVLELTEWWEALLLGVVVLIFIELVKAVFRNV